MMQTSRLKKQLTWELLNRRTVNLISDSNLAKHRKTTKFGLEDVVYYDMTGDQDYEFVVHTVSDRALKRIIKYRDLFDNSPYISCSLVNSYLGMFMVNPSLLQANIVLDFQANAVVYTIGYDIGSATNKYNTKNQQRIFLDKLQRQTFFANTIDDKLREIAYKTDMLGARNWNKLPAIVDKISSAVLSDELQSANPKNGRIEALPLLSTDMLRNNTKKHPQKNVNQHPYNEILIDNSQAKIKAIVFNQVDWGNALQAIELNNVDAIDAMNTLIESKLPIIIIKNKFDHQYNLSASPSAEEQLQVACKNHDINLLHRLIKTIDVEKFGGAALQEACYQGDFAIVKLLIEQGADVNYDNGKCLEAAFYRGNVHIARFLFEHGAVIGSLQQLEKYLVNRPNEQLSTMLENSQSNRLHL